MPVRSQQFGSWALVSGSADTTVVPAGQVWLVRDISCVNFSAVAEPIEVYATEGPGAPLRATMRFTIASGQQFIAQRYLIIPAGGQIQVVRPGVVGSTSTVHGMACGARLTE